MLGQFIVGIENLKCEARLGPGLALNDDLRIINDPKYAECLDSRIFHELAGTLETSSFGKMGLLAISPIQEFPDIDGPLLVERLLSIVRSYLSTLWLIKDNAALFDRGYFVRNDRVHSNIHVTSYFNSEGRRRSVTLSRAELEAAKRFLRPYLRSLPDDYTIPKDKLMLDGGTTPAARTVRLGERFLAFIEYARQSVDLPFRIAMSCVALEALFSTGTSELTHRVSERVAFLLEKEPVKRQEIYKLVKSLYSVRSAFLHGDAVGSREEGQLLHLSQQADAILRAVARLLLGDGEFAKAVRAGKDALDVFHSRLLFGLQDQKSV